MTSQFHTPNGPHDFQSFWTLPPRTISQNKLSNISVIVFCQQQKLANTFSSTQSAKAIWTILMIFNYYTSILGMFHSVLLPQDIVLAPFRSWQCATLLHISLPSWVDHSVFQLLHLNSLNSDILSLVLFLSAWNSIISYLIITFHCLRYKTILLEYWIHLYTDIAHIKCSKIFNKVINFVVLVKP